MSDEEQSEARKWDQKWALWTIKGCPENNEKIPMPGPHPESGHLWNIDPVAWCKSKNIDWKPKVEGEPELEDY